jgi:hypothetical protein
MRAVRAPGRLRLLLAAFAVPAAVAALGVGIQAAAFSRPPHDALIATNAIRELLRYHVMRATENVGGRRVRATCLQGWFRAMHRRRPAPGALVVLSNGVKLYDFGRGVRRVGLRGVPSQRDLARFLLAGCPRYIGDHVGSELVSSHWVDLDPSRADGASALALDYGRVRAPVEVFVDPRTYRPIEIHLSGYPAHGWSDLRPGGGAPAIARVRRAFHLPVRPHRNA